MRWTRGGDAPYLFWALVDPERTGDPARMRWSGIAEGPEGQRLLFDYDRAIADAAGSGLALVWNVAVEPHSLGFAHEGRWMPVDEAAYVAFVQAAVRRDPQVRA